MTSFESPSMIIEEKINALLRLPWHWDQKEISAQFYSMTGSLNNSYPILYTLY